MLMSKGLKDGSNVGLPDMRPCFFKIVFDDLINKQLRIPPCFVKHLSKELFDGATLKGPSGSCWNIKLRRTTGGVYLQDGWPQFFRDHSLGDNEFLLFRYDENMCFEVQIFDKSGCERLGVSVIKNHQESALPSGKRKRGRPRKNPLVSVHHHPLKSCEDCPEKLKKFTKEKDTPVKIKTEEVDWPTIERHKEVRKVKGERLTCRRIKMEAENKTELCIQKMDSELKNVKNGKKIPRKIEREEKDPPISEINSCAPSEQDRTMVWEGAESFASKHPYFKVSLKKASVNKVYILNIPVSFAKKHLPRAKSKMVLRNPDGNCWEVNLILAGGKHFFCGGWAAFVHGNKLGEGDVCIFELLDTKELQVHIFQ